MRASTRYDAAAARVDGIKEGALGLSFYFLRCPANISKRSQAIIKAPYRLYFT